MWNIQCDIKTVYNTEHMSLISYKIIMKKDSSLHRYIIVLSLAKGSMSLGGFSVSTWSMSLGVSVSRGLGL